MTFTLKETLWNYAIPLVPAYHMLPRVSNFLVTLDPFPALPGVSQLSSDLTPQILKYLISYFSCYYGTKLARKLAIAALLRSKLFIKSPKSIFTRDGMKCKNQKLGGHPTFIETVHGQYSDIT